jgi:type I restriction enzyme S subunit
MSVSWPKRKLRDIAAIRVSNVDKKKHPNEIPVKLCNYMDVYSNDYVTSKIDFMEASATLEEIERFGLNAGDVIITKDSETPDDIGIPTVITEDISGLVCGYHCALIRPDKKQLDSVYLAKQLSTSQVTRYFSLLASGSTRYGLPVSVIESVEIPTPPKIEQSKIAEILSTVDRAIEQTEGLIAKQKRIKTGLMQDLLTRGIDEHGNLRSEETHEFKDSPLGRIPLEWEPIKLGELAQLKRGYDITEETIDEGLFPVISSSGIIGYHSQATSTGPNVVIGRKGTIGKIHFIEDDFWAHDTSLYVTNFWGNHEKFVYYLFLYLDLARFGTKSGSPSLNRNDIHPLWIGRPETNEQIAISKRLDQNILYSRVIEAHLLKFRSIKTALMQDLLTGKVRVTSLLENIEGCL